MKLKYCFDVRMSRMISIFVAVAAFAGLSGGIALAQDEAPEFTTDFRLEDCKFKARGTNPYFILRPGYQLVFEGEDDGKLLHLVVTVLHETETISVPGLGRVRTRVVEERESANGALVEVSKNFFAICKRTNDVVYFGEEVDIFHEDGSVTHEGAWRAGENGARPGIMMPGTFLLGSRYFQEIAPGVALDRAEHVEMGLEVMTEAGAFERCARVIETTPLEAGSESEKVYCPGVGLVQDNEAELVYFGRDVVDDNDEED